MSLRDTSKYLSWVLRHEPDAIGLALEPGGWAPLAQLIERACADGRSLDEETIRRVMRESDRRRFELSDDGERIRATYGHSIDVDLDREPVEPPETLYHGTARSSVASIREEGIQPRGRRYVHLSSTREEARRVGRRHGEPVVLEVRAGDLHRQGRVFYDTPADVWLVREVPPNFIELPGVR
ncbi:MAG: RNA 2'-phosphotransferase [Bradymonadaceae bacterium]